MAFSFAQMIIIFVICFVVIIGLFYLITGGLGTSMSAVLFEFFGGVFAV
jgi:hypothetical protein